MRICRKCHSEIEEDMLFCPECGVRYVCHDTQAYSAENCPIAVVEQNLITSEDGTEIVILFANISNEAVNAVSVRLKCYDQMEDELTDTIVKYSDLSVESGEFFGKDKIIIPADADTRSFKIIIEKVLLEESGLIKNVFSEFIKNDNLNYIREQNDKITEEEKKEEIESQSRELLNRCLEIVRLSANLQTRLDNVLNSFSVENLNIINERQKLRYQLFSLIHPCQITKFIIPSDMATIFNSKYVLLNLFNLIVDHRSAWEKLETLVLPEGLTEIGDSSLRCLSSLKNIYIPSTVRKIDTCAFENCYSLKEIIVPDRAEIHPDAFKNCPAKVSTQSKQLMEEERKRREQYWAAHAEEKQQLEEELKRLKSSSESDNEKIPGLNGRILDLKKQRDFISVPSEQEKEKISNKISTLRTRMNSLGIFKGKEKKAVQAQIDELQSKLPALDDVIEQEKEARKKEINAEIAKIEEELKPFNDKKLQLQKRIDEINQELTKPR
ncbi:MAG: leucine-rich repeat protein [Oscillospiraceae bacterium]|nr:leucine-rich repeat protein [Oscillospiraceae bacterium]